MATFTENPSYDNVVILETTDDVLGGGATSPSNKQTQSLVNRTKWLKDAIATINTAITAINQSLGRVVNRHLSGTNITYPTDTGWTLDLNKIGPTQPAGLREVNLWKYQLPEDCHIMRINPRRQPWYGEGSGLTPTVAHASGHRATLYKILPPVVIYDGYELIVQVDCSDTTPVAYESRYFSILGQLTVISDAVNYLGNIQISTQKEEVLRVFSSGLSYDNKCAQGYYNQRSILKWQMINIGANDLRTAGSVVANSPFTQYCLNMLYIKFKWNITRQLWEQIGLSQPYVS